MTQSATDPTVTATAKRRRWPWIAAAAIVVLAALAIGGYQLHDRSRPLADDPAGATACKMLAQWIQGDVKDPDTGKPYAKLVLATGVSNSAAASTTLGISAAVGGDFMDTDAGALLKSYGGPASFRVTDLPKLHDACAAAGVKMPAYAEPAG